MLLKRRVTSSISVFLLRRFRAGNGGGRGTQLPMDTGTEVSDESAFRNPLWPTEPILYVVEHKQNWNDSVVRLVY